MNRPLLTRFLIVLAAIAMAIHYVWPPDEKITLGLDLRGGTSYTLQLDLSKTTPEGRKEALEKAMEIIRKRVDGYGVGEPIIQTKGENRIEVQIPGLEEGKKKSTREQLERVALLEFRLVHPRNSEELAAMRARGNIPPPGYELMTLVEKGPGQHKGIEEPVLIRKKADITGRHLRRAVPVYDAGGYQVAFELDAQGGRMFRTFTRENIGNRLAIVLDNKLISAPRINDEIGDRGVITGNFDQREVFDLASALENPLETPVKIIEERGVDPALGADSIRSGLYAGIVGLALVVVFMQVYYLRAGFIANIALLVNILLLFGVLAIFKFTLTLPGVAGIILTVGIAVDANVLIYERIREELRKGKPLVAAIDAGFDRAFSTIIDANVTTLITSLVLAKLGTGPVQGFGLTLSAGIVTSVFSAVVISRLIFDFLLQNTNFKKLTMLSMVRQTSINFLGFRWPAILLSSTIIIAGALVAIKRGHEIYGVDFTGGDSLTLAFKEKVDVSDIRKTLQNQNLFEPFIQYQREVRGGGEVLQIKVPFEAGSKVERSLIAAYPQADFKLLQLDKVGGSVGGELQRTAIQGLFVAALLILIYITIRFEFAYAVGAIVALLHDVLVCLALYFITGRQLSLPAIGALLTIAGYSLNDTIVVFDRIREEFRLKGEKYGFTQIINLSVNETLGRTLLTSLTTFIASFSLYVFGGGVINDFAFILVAGVITGTYSSVFIASPVLLFWHPSKLAPKAEEASGSVT